MPVLFGCVVVLLSAGCGGGSGGGGHRLSETAFRSRANQICKQLTSQERADSSSASKAALDRNLARIDSTVSRLEGLNPPAGDEQRYNDLLTSFKRSLAFVKANEARVIQLAHQLRLHPSDTHAQARYQQLVAPFVQEARLAATNARALGLSACESGFTGGSAG